MPGSIYGITCEGCGVQQEIHTGVGDGPEGKRWSYRQWVCEACEKVVSVATDDDQPEDAPPPSCECGAVLVPWRHHLWFDYREELGMRIPSRERFAGPCPACGKTVTESEQGGDGTVLSALWD